MSKCNHQSLHLVGVEGIAPPNARWYECRNQRCGQRLLLQLIATYPEDKDRREARERKIPVDVFYRAKDNTAWDTLQEAKARNLLIKEIEEIEALLYPRPAAVNKGQGYLQQRAETVQEVRERVIKLIARTYNKTLTPSTTLRGLAMEIIDTIEMSEEDPLYRIYMRLASIDSYAREWQNTYLAENPENGKQVEIEPEKKPASDKEKHDGRAKEGQHGP